MQLLKAAKPVLLTIACAASIYIVEALITGPVLGLMPKVRYGLPGGAFACIICMYLVCYVSISIVTFGTGLLHLTNLQIIRLGVIIYLVWEWLTSMDHYVFTSLKITGSFSYLFPIVATSLCALVLLASLISLGRLHAGGRILRDKMKKAT